MTHTQPLNEREHDEYTFLYIKHTLISIFRSEIEKLLVSFDDQRKFHGQHDVVHVRPTQFLNYNYNVHKENGNQMENLFNSISVLILSLII